MRCIAILPGRTARARPAPPLRLIGAFLACLAAAGCADRNFEINSQNREQTIADFTAGRTDLPCTINCIWSDARHRERMAEFYKLGRWEALVRLVIESGYGIDRNYYFLGRSAEELGAREAAAIYYRRALFQPQRGQCQTYHSANVCVGFDVPRRARERLQMLERAGRTSVRR